MKENDLVKSVREQYERNKQKATSGNKMSQEEREKKFFTLILPKGSTSIEKRIRILPTKDGSSPFVEARFHEIQVDGKWVKLYDPEQENKRSPLNEVRRSLLATGLESDKELAKSYMSRTFYIVKLIDRDRESDGPKFWRFKHNSKKEGIYDKIFPIFLNKGDITDVKTGRDLVLYLTLTKSNNGKEYTIVNSIIPEDVSSLSESKEQVDEWVNDTLTWSDVYSVKSEDYLELVARGETPKWSTVSNKWISNDEEEVSDVASYFQSSGSNITTEDPQSSDEPDEDLPF